LWYTNNDPICGGTATSSWIFTTYERDAESGLQNGNDYAFARSYASGNGHFLSPDPLGGDPSDPQSWNRYAYVENDPINLADPSGQGFWDDLVNLFLDIGSILSGGQSASDLTNALGCDSGPDCGGTQFNLIYGGAQTSPEFGGGISAGGSTASGGGWAIFQGAAPSAAISLYAGLGGNQPPIPCPVCHPSNPALASDLAQFTITQFATAGLTAGTSAFFEPLAGIQITGFTTIGPAVGSGGEASEALLNLMAAHGRTIIIAEEGSEALRYLNARGAEAVSFDDTMILRPGASRATAMEESTFMRL